MDGSLFGTLIVIFAKAKNLPNRRSLGKQNPYCVARVGHDAQRCPSDIRGGQTPTWDHEVRFKLMDILEHRKMKLSVLDENDSKVELVGDAVIILDDAFQATPKQGFDRWHELTYKGKYAGEVYLEMTFYPAKPALPPKRRVKKGSRTSSPRESLRSSQSTLHMRASIASSNPARPLPCPDDILSMSSLVAALPCTACPPGERQHATSTNNGYGHSNPTSASSSFSSAASSSFHSASHGSGRDSMRSSTGSNGRYGSPPLPPHTLRPSQSPPPFNYSTDSSGSSSGVTQSHRIRRKPVGSAQHSQEDSFDLDDANLNLPFSPSDYEAFNQSTIKPKRKSLPSRPDGRVPDELIDPRFYHPEPQPRSTLPPLPTEIDPGLAGYNGGGQWDISKKLNDGYSDSVYNKAVDHKLPRLPPKIPVGITEEEYLAVEPQAEPHMYYYNDPYGRNAY